MTDTVNVFTYGSLMQGLGNHRVMQRAGGYFLGKASIKGVRLHAYCSSFPGACKGVEANSTHGEIYSVPKEGLKHLDALEGNGTFYTREFLSFKYEDGEEVEAWIYLLPKHKCRGEFIENGDWRSYRTDYKPLYGGWFSFNDR